MSLSTIRQDAVADIHRWHDSLRQLPEAKRPREIFGKEVFSERVMRERLPKAVFKAVQRTMHYGQPLAPEVADTVLGWRFPNPQSRYRSRRRRRRRKRSPAHG